MKIALRPVVVAVVVASMMVFAFGARALAADGRRAEDTQADVTHPDAELPSAPVEIDGTVLFQVRGAAAFPAEKRATAIVARIEALAADANVPADAVRPVEVENGTAIVAGRHRMMVVQDADATLESVDRNALASAIARDIGKSVAEYRQARSGEALMRSAALGGVATAILATLVPLVIWLSRRLHAALERRYRQRLQALGIQSFQIVRAEQLWGALTGTLAAVRAIVILLIGFIYLQYVLGLFPWTRGIANRLLGYVVDPLRTMGLGLVNEIPDLVFLAILFFVTRYLLKLTHLFFSAVGRGEVTLSGFAPEWAERPTGSCAPASSS